MSDAPDRPVPSLQASKLWRRVLAGFTVALALAFSTYLLMNASRTNTAAFASVWFLAVLPAFLSALICYIGDPRRTRGNGFYWAVPAVLVGLVDLGSVVVLHEGAICLLMLSPIWLVGGWIGAFVLRGRRDRKIDPNVFRSTLLGLPLMLGGIESQVPFTPEAFTVTRHVVVQASPAEVWPYALSNAHIDDKEGLWTFSQNIVGLPRPRATVMHGSGVGAVRTAYWGDHISFDEDITQWQPGKRLGWSFAFPNDSLQAYSDEHISPDGPFLKIDSGDYSLEPLGPDKTLLTLRTHYIARTHVNAYAAVWGEILLGDIQTNVLAVVKHRAEAHARDLALSARP
jgi:hypothetical protein